MVLPLAPHEVRLRSRRSSGPRRQFRMLAYTGAEVARSWGRFVIDLSVIFCPAWLPILLEHDDAARVGIGTRHALTDEGLVLEGFLLEESAPAAAIARDADQGFPFRASVGVRILESEEVRPGQSVRVNGQELEGPLTVARRTHLFETSFVAANPADLATSAEVLASWPERLRAEKRALRIEHEHVLAARATKARDRHVRAVVEASLAAVEAVRPRRVSRAAFAREAAACLLATVEGIERSERRLRLLANAGSVMHLDDEDVVLDLDGLVSGREMPVLVGHRETMPVGVVDVGRVTAAGLELEGAFLETELAGEVAELAATGRLEASLGYCRLRTERVRAGELALANGRVHEGPLRIVRRARLLEVSLVAAGADPNTWVFTSGSFGGARPSSELGRAAALRSA